MFLPNYKFDVDTGIWISREETEQKTRLWLGEIDYSSGEMTSKQMEVRKLLPFEVVDPAQIKSFEEYKE